MYLEAAHNVQDVPRTLARAAVADQVRDLNSRNII